MAKTGWQMFLSSIYLVGLKLTKTIFYWLQRVTARYFQERASFGISLNLSIIRFIYLFITGATATKAEVDATFDKIFIPK